VFDDEYGEMFQATVRRDFNMMANWCYYREKKNFDERISAYACQWPRVKTYIGNAALRSADLQRGNGFGIGARFLLGL
jgi:hypothetical protein